MQIVLQIKNVKTAKNYQTVMAVAYCINAKKALARAKLLTWLVCHIV